MTPAISSASEANPAVRQRRIDVATDVGVLLICASMLKKPRTFVWVRDRACKPFVLIPVAKVLSLIAQRVRPKADFRRIVGRTPKKRLKWRSNSLTCLYPTFAETSFTCNDVTSSSSLAFAIRILMR